MINVLHLSDLHISHDSEALEYSILKNKIIASIKKNFNNGKIDIVAVTGDIIDKGSVDSFKEATAFFKELSDELSIPNSAFYFVAGNHDANRDPNMETVINAIINEKKQLFYNFSKFDNTFRRAYLARYEDFINFASSINPITSGHSEGGGVDDSFDVIEIVARGDKVRLILLNSSICTFGNDYQKIGISKHQLDRLATKCKVSKFKPDITLALLHHPLDWFLPSEKKQLVDYFSDSSLLGVDVVLHGHTHDGKVSGSFDIDSSIVYLVSGIGYDRTTNGSEEALKTSYRIAFYSFDVEHKKICGKLLKSNRKLDFKPDTSAYSDVDNDGVFELYYKNRYDGQEKINGSTAQDSVHIPLPLEQKMELDQDIVRYLGNVIENKYRLQSHLASDFVSNVSEFKEKKRQLKLPRTNLNTHEKGKLNSLKREYFKAFLKLVCISTISFLFPDENAENIRTHFRIYEKSDKTHRTFVSSLDNGDDMHAISWSNGKNLIYHSYKNGRSLVNSENPDLSYNTQGEWTDFITIPLHEYTRSNQIPKLSFGISVKGDSITSAKILKLLSFVRIECLLQDILRPCENTYDYKKLL